MIVISLLISLSLAVNLSLFVRSVTAQCSSSYKNEYETHPRTRYHVSITKASPMFVSASLALLSSRRHLVMKVRVILFDESIV